MLVVIYERKEHKRRSELQPLCLSTNMSVIVGGSSDADRGFYLFFRVPLQIAANGESPHGAQTASARCTRPRFVFSKR